MKLKSSIIAIIALSSMSFAGGDIGGVTSFENNDMVAAEVEAVEAIPTTIPTAIPIATPAPIIATPTPMIKKEVVKEIPTRVEKTSSKFGPYIGLAISEMAVRSDDRVNLFGDEEHQDQQLGITAVIGYNFMKYLGAELRAALSVANENDGQDNLAEYGIYLKPQYPVLDNLNVYGLLGYSAINMSDPATSTNYNDNPFDGDNQGFSFGAGVDYGVTENISVFTDVVNYLRDFGGSNSTWGANLGVKYNF
jgi:opacity protein-like surface antigen